MSSQACPARRVDLCAWRAGGGDQGAVGTGVRAATVVHARAIAAAVEDYAEETRRHVAQEVPVAGATGVWCRGQHLAAQVHDAPAAPATGAVQRRHAGAAACAHEARAEKAKGLDNCRAAASATAG